MATQNDYEHEFKRDINVTGAKGIIFQLIGKEGTIKYNESVSQPENKTEFKRTIDVENAKGMELRLPENDPGTLIYSEKIEFKKQQS